MVPPERLKPTTLYLKTSTLPLVGSIGKYICLTFISACLLTKKEKKNVVGSPVWTPLAKIPGAAHGSASIQTWATIGLPATRHSDGVSSAGR